jgi:phage terminase large subunit-like protein
MDRKDKVLRMLEEQLRQKKENALSFYSPYPKQREFHDLGATKRERLLIAANRSGKTFSGAMEMAMHLTGRYPKWWQGRRFDRPVRAWAASDTATTTRDILQLALCGPMSELGTGAIPFDAVDWDKDVLRAHSVGDAFDTIEVSHVSGRKSHVSFKSFDQGRKRFQGTAQDVIHLDEEAPFDVYSECLTRIAPRNAGDASGLIYTTFTPLLGRSDVVLRFLDEPSPDRGVVNMTLHEAEHISPEEKERIIAGYAPHEREARVFGTPQLGSGRIFPFSEESVRCAPFDVPSFFAKIVGFDFGTGHPFAAVRLAWDRDADMIYVTHCFKMKDALPYEHWDAIKPWAENIPVAWPQDGHTKRDDGAGDLKSLRDIYRKHGARMLAEHAQFIDGSRSTEAGIVEMAERMQTNRLKVFSTCAQWFEEFRFYHRKDGLIQKHNDDIMSATRIAVMDRRHAAIIKLDASGNVKRGGVQMAKDCDEDPFGF